MSWLFAWLLGCGPLADHLAHRHGLPPAVAREHVAAARLAAAGGGIEVELLLAVADVESRYQADSVSRVEHGRRVTGRWRSSKPAGSGPRFCGALQAQAGSSWRRCLELRDLRAGYRAAADELREWLDWTGGDLAAALRGHGCGWRGVRGQCRGYDRRVLRRVTTIKQGATS
jgi:hypothetical protein